MLEMCDGGNVLFDCHVKLGWVCTIYVHVHVGVYGLLLIDMFRSSLKFLQG